MKFDTSWDDSLILILIKLTLIMSSDNWPTTKRGFHMAHLNLQSMNNKADLVKYYVKELGFDLFTFSESWLNPILPSSLFAISG